MGKIFYIMGKSSSGKDTVYERLLAREELGLRRVIMYTTRPIRSNETDGVQYHFVSIDQMEQMNADGKVIELRRYDTIAGPWYYFTADSQHMNLEQHNYLALGTLESFVKMQRYYGKDRVVPIYMEVEDGLRLERALSRERQIWSPDTRKCADVFWQIRRILRKRRFRRPVSRDAFLIMDHWMCVWMKSCHLFLKI